MWKKLIITPILIFSFTAYSQDILTFKVKSKNTDKGIENVLMNNKSNNDFAYSSKDGISKLKYQNINDSVEMSLPGYHIMKTNINSIIENELTLYMEEKIELLDEVLIKSNNPPDFDYKFQFAKGKKYYTEIISADAAILSTYKQKECDECFLNAVKFYFDTTVLSQHEEVFIRPLIYDFNKTNLLENPNIFSLNNISNEVIVKFSKSPVRLQKNLVYFIGFEIINKTRSAKKLKVRVLNSKKDYALIRGNPTVDWFKQDNLGDGFSLDYELFFIEE